MLFLLDLLIAAYWYYNRILRRVIVLRTIPKDGCIVVESFNIRIYYGQRVVLLLPPFLSVKDVERIETSVRARFEAHLGYTPPIRVRFAEWKPITLAE